MSTCFSNYRKNTESPPLSYEEGAERDDPCSEKKTNRDAQQEQDSLVCWAELRLFAVSLAPSSPYHHSYDLPGFTSAQKVSCNKAGGEGPKNNTTNPPPYLVMLCITFGNEVNGHLGYYDDE